jgi:hypothetical protein
MKKCILIITMVLITTMTFAQDVIVKKDGSTILSSVKEIGSTEIKYKKWSNQDGPMYTIRISDVIRINFENGAVESFAEEALSSVVSDKPSSDLPTFTDGELVLGAKNQVYKNKQKVSDEELRLLLGREWYEDYVSARRTDNAGTTVFGIGLLGGIAGGLALGIGLGLHEPIPTTIGAVVLGIAVPCFIVGLAIPDRRRDILDEYNLYNKSNKPTSAVKLQIAPSITGCSYAQDKVGLGMTVAINF